jgi:hypothetical protein
MAKQPWENDPIVVPAGNAGARPAVEFDKPATPPSPPAPTRDTERFVRMTDEEVIAAKLNPMQPYQINQAGKIEPIGGTPLPAQNVNRPSQIRTTLDALQNIRKLANQTLSVGEMAGRVRAAPVVGALFGQNRADLEGALNMVQGNLIQDQLAQLAKINPGGMASLANQESEAQRLASSIANLDPNQSLEQFLMGVDRAEQYFNRQLEQAGETPTQGRIVTAPGTTSGTVMGAIQGGQPIMTPQDLEAGKAIQEAWNRTGRFADTQAVAAQYGRLFGQKEAAFLQANEGKPVTINPNPTGQPTAAEQSVGEFVATPMGETVAAGMTSSANAMTLGLLDELAPVLGLDADRVQAAKRYLQERNVGASLVGEVAGSIGPTGLISRGVNTALLGGRAANLAPLAGDTIAGILAGAGESNQNRLGGALLGGTLGGAGGALGRRVFGGTPPAGGAPDGGAPMGGMGGPMGAPPAGGAPMGGPMGGMGGPSGGRASGGAAATPSDVIRVSRSQELPVPVSLMNFQRTRDFADVQAARELAKNGEVGGPIRERMAQQQQQIAANFDSFLDQTGAEVLSNLEQQGARITAGIKSMADKSKAKYRALYTRARQAGETLQPVNYRPVLDAISAKLPTEQDEKVLRIAREAIARNDPDGTGQLSIEAMEAVRKAIGNNMGDDPNQIRLGGEMKNIIDGILNDAGGNVYRSSRAAFREHQETFKEIGIIAQLLGTKRNSTDRVVAAENVVARILAPGTEAAQLRKMRDLVTGEGGDPQAWNEVQGAVMEQIRRAAYPASATKDSAGNVEVSPAGLARAVDRLDQSGKLALIFDGGTAQGLRTLRDVAQDTFTAPSGSINFSNNSAWANRWMNGLDLIINTVVTGLPVNGGVVNNILKPLRQNIKDQPLRQEVRRLVGDNAQ